MSELSEEEIKVQDLIEHIRFGTPLKYAIKDYIVAIEGLLDLYNKEKEKNEILEDTLNNSIDIRKYWISKDKIKDKIEELKKEADYRTIDNPTGRIHFHKEPCDYQIEVLQELLEERN